MLTATAADIIARFDVRLLGQLASDNNTPVSPSGLLIDPNMNAALEDASGVVLSALYTAYKYLPSDIAGLDTESLSLLKRITCDLAFVYMANRRGYEMGDKYPILEDSYFLLQKLRNGERVLNVAGNENAGLAASDYISVQQQAAIGLVTSCWRYFPIGSGCGCCGN